MKAEYKRDLQNNYLILEAPQEAEEDSYQIRMVEQNQIPGLLTVHSSRKDGKLFLNYEITSKQQLEGLYDLRPLNYRDIFFLLTSLAETLAEMQKYLLNPAMLVYDPQYIYVSADRKKLFLCYLPDENSEFPIVMLAEFILKKLNHEDWKAVELGYSFYQKASAENFSLQETVKELLAESRKEEQRDFSGARGSDSDMPQAFGGETSQEQRFGLPQGKARRTMQQNLQGSPGEEPDGTPPEKYGEPKQKRNGILREESYGRSQQKRCRGLRKEPDGISQDILQTEYARNPLPEYREQPGADWGEPTREELEVEHKQRNRRPQKDRAIDRVFQVIHPAVLLSGLLLLIVLEIVFYIGVIGVTEAGGVFFLLIAVEALINKVWKAARQKKREYHEISEEDEEAYEALREEMYQEQAAWQEEARINQGAASGVGRNGQLRSGVNRSGSSYYGASGSGSSRYGANGSGLPGDAACGSRLPGNGASGSESPRDNTCESGLPGNGASGKGLPGNGASRSKMMNAVSGSRHYKHDWPGSELSSDGSRSNEAVINETPGYRMEIEETRCLVSVPEKKQARLVCRAANSLDEKFPDIEVWSEPVYIGKIEGESDVILDSPTVSRVHARLECRKDGCYVKDLNSRNGTFVNEKRLKPQEQCEIRTGDILRFAETEYHVVIADSETE